MCLGINSTCPCTSGARMACGCGGTMTCTYGAWGACSSPAKHLDCIAGACGCADNTDWAKNDVCQIGDDAICKGITPPSVTVNPLVGADYCNGIPNGGLANFQWNFNSAAGDETAYELQISTSSGDDFDSNKVFDTGIVPGSAQSKGIYVYSPVTNPAADCSSSTGACGSYINYGSNTKYYWKIEVWDKNGQSASDATTVAYTFPYAHPAPAVIYTVPTSVAPTNAADFTDQSICYDDNGGQYDCKQLVPDSSLGTHVCSAATGVDAAGKNACYSWWFNLLNKTTPDDWTIGSTTNSYPLSGTYTTKLQVCDDIGCCSATTNLKVGTSNAGIVPQWWEISPYQTTPAQP